MRRQRTTAKEVQPAAAPQAPLSISEPGMTLSSHTPPTDDSMQSSASLSSSNDHQDPPRVLIYTTCYNVLDGVTLIVRHLEREILAAGGHVCILSTASGLPANTNLVETHPNRQVIFLDNSLPLPIGADPNNPSITYHLGVSLSESIRDQMDEFQPDIIHITAPDLTALHVQNYARARQVPLMGTYHSNIPDYLLFIPGARFLKAPTEMLLRHIYNFLQKLYVPTPFIQRKLCDEQKMDCYTDVEVWGHGVDLERFTPTKRSESFRQKLNIPPECPVIIYVGRLVVEKRLDIFASIVKRLTAEKKEFRALIVGAGPAQYLIDDLPNTHHLGWLSGEELPEAFASSEVFLFPSSVETFGLVTLEAAASGLPLVVEAKCSGHLVNHGSNGFVCDAGDTESFYSATLALVENKKLRESCAKESIALSQTLGQDMINRRMLTYYTEVRKEFYEKYGGSHSNRDEVYNTPDSFYFGIDPRPFGWISLEIFILTVVRLGNIVDAIVKKWSKKKDSGSYNKVRTHGDDDEDIELGRSQSDDSIADINGVSDDEEVELGRCASCLIAIGDSPITSNILVGMLSILIFFVRNITMMMRRCRKKRCCGTKKYVFEQVAEQVMQTEPRQSHTKRVV